VHNAIVIGESHGVALKVVILVGRNALQRFNPAHQVSAFGSELVDGLRLRVEVGAGERLGAWKP
jgi:hypothetical protein